MNKFLVIIVSYFSKELEEPVEEYFSMPVVKDVSAEIFGGS